VGLQQGIAAGEMGFNDKFAAFSALALFRRADAGAARHRLLTAVPVSLSVSTCAAKVRARLLKARSALSCCGILTTAETPPAKTFSQQNGIRICIDYTQIRVR
jgi:hypothetical protein